jgi:hypothetical protein
MIQCRQESRFALEAGELVRIVAELVGENFYRDVPPELRISGAVHPAHAARTENGEDS